MQLIVDRLVEFGNIRPLMGIMCQGSLCASGLSSHLRTLSCSSSQWGSFWSVRLVAGWKADKFVVRLIIYLRSKKIRECFSSFFLAKFTNSPVSSCPIRPIISPSIHSVKKDWSARHFPHFLLDAIAVERRIVECFMQQDNFGML